MMLENGILTVKAAIPSNHDRPHLRRPVHDGVIGCACRPALAIRKMGGGGVAQSVGNGPKDGSHGTHTPHARREAYVRGRIVSGRVNPNPGRIPRPVRYLGIVGRVYTRGV
eukprot:3201902-Amphidinium_carterae.2